MDCQAQSDLYITFAEIIECLKRVRGDALHRAISPHRLSEVHRQMNELRDRNEVTRYGAAGVVTTERGDRISKIRAANG
jgi:hypothetical protein